MKIVQMSKTKCIYLIDFGVGPHFRDNLLKDIKKILYFSVSFDETLNWVLQEEQMGVTSDILKMVVLVLG